LNADNPDLDKLQNKGAKILMYFGWGDSAITPLGGIEYYEQVAKRIGGFDKAQDFFRLFLVPGMAHCGSGPGANAFGQPHSGSTPPLKDDPAFSMTRALEAWVEQGRAPQQVIAAKYREDDPAKGVAFTRPLCPYPQVAVYNGSGDILKHESFECRM